MRVTALICAILTIIGGIVWGLVGIFNFNIITAIFGYGGAGYVFARIIYALVGLSALWLIFYLVIYHPFRKRNG